MLIESFGIAKPKMGPVSSDNIPIAKDKHFVPRDDIITAIDKVFLLLAVIDEPVFMD